MILPGSSSGLPRRQEPAHEERRLPAPPQAGDLWIDWGPPLPEGYGQDRVALLVRDPWCVFCYWELTGPHARWVAEQHGPRAFSEGRWKLRLSADGEPLLEVDASHPLGSRYTAVDPAHAFRADLGLLMPDGTWIQVATSAEIRTPHAEISRVVDDRWPVSDEEMLAQLGMSPEEAAKRLEQMRAADRAGYGVPRPDGSSPSK